MQIDVTPQDLDVIAEALGKLPLEKSLGTYHKLLAQYQAITKKEAEAKLAAEQQNSIEKVVPANG